MCHHDYYLDYIYITSSGVAETVRRCANCNKRKIREATEQDFIDAKNIIDVKLDKNELIIDFGIGLVFSKENYQQSSSQKNVNTLFKSESVDLAITLALLANSK